MESHAPRASAPEPSTKNSMDNEELSVGNCPHCTKTLFRDAAFNSEATFMTRCPHCQKSVKVCVRKRVEIVLIPVEPKQSDRKENGKTGAKLGVIIALFFLPSIHTIVMDNLEIFDKLV
jgi:acetyl-CoA carboxylase beta subunit